MARFVLNDNYELVANQLFVKNTNRAARELVSKRKLSLTVLFLLSLSLSLSICIRIYIDKYQTGREFTKRLLLESSIKRIFIILNFII